MSYRYRSARAAVLAMASMAAISGCSPHAAPTLTPVDSAKTPTFRSSTNSYNQPNTPLYTQPGINTGKKTSLPSLPPSNKFNQNAPLALAVYGQLQQRLGVNNVRYVALQSRGSTVLLSGTVASTAIAAQAKAIATKTAGVRAVVDHIKVQS